ncbi:MAG: putative DNA modification/repair radical SAM protein [Spirochaetales bacterium]|nr:putative DNA modification/repair radical SAM protein [Spirochaetales bacterium]
MELAEKLAILADSAKYDASCASSGSQRTSAGGIGATRTSGVCHTWSADGRCVSLLKLLYTNRCVYDCAYCVNRRSNDIRRVSFTVDEIVTLTMDFYRRNYIEGLFLSSGIAGDPDYTMTRLGRVARRLREEERFGGYIHLKVIPGASRRIVEEAGRFADRLSVNIELPSERSLVSLAPQKTKRTIVGTMGHLSEKLAEIKEDQRRRLRRVPTFAPAGQSTQLIVGASPESDRTIMTLSSYFYRAMGLRRVYYSAFVPVAADRRLPLLDVPPLRREHRLYQADWLIRLYKFDVEELFSGDREDIDIDLDPKSGWALRHYHMFPVEVGSADYEMLLRVPGIGLRTAARIVRLRRRSRITFDTLRKIGVVLKRARYFITCGGVHLESRDLTVDLLRAALVDAPRDTRRGSAAGLIGGRGGTHTADQLSLFGGVGSSRDAVVRADEPVRESAVIEFPSRDRAAAPGSPGRALRYDGTFTGLSTLLERLLCDRSLPIASIERTARRAGGQAELFAGAHLVATDRDTARAFARRFEALSPVRWMERFYGAFLSERPDIEVVLAHLARLLIAVDTPPSADASRRASLAMEVENAERRLFREVHRFMGILRFRAAGRGEWVAEIEPDCDVLPFLAPHFVRRMSGEHWRIVDLRRRRTAAYDSGRLRITEDGSDDADLRVSITAAVEDDERATALWRDYVRRIAVEERTNRALQQHFLPKKYWRHLPEMDDLHVVSRE